jgi:OmcA/MtrC family decaheme c-type cytochrome
MMTNGLALYESFQFKRMIHGIHGNTKRTYPFTHGNKVVDAFNKDGTSTTPGNPALLASVENYAAEVAWPGGQDFQPPGTGVNCNVCHVNNSYQNDLGPLATMVLKPTGVLDPMLWNVITPMAASCSGCHDSPAAMSHMTSVGQANFGTPPTTQKVRAQEICRDCHAVGGVKGVDLVHGQ